MFNYQPGDKLSSLLGLSTTPSLRLTTAGEPDTEMLSSSDVTIVALCGLLP